MAQSSASRRSALSAEDEDEDGLRADLAAVQRIDSAGLLSRASREEREDCAALQEVAVSLAPAAEPRPTVRDALARRLASGDAWADARFSFT